MKKALLLSAYLLVCHLSVVAQLYNQVTYLIGTQYYAGNKYVEVSTIGTPTTATSGCNTPYWIGLNTPSGYIYKFSNPVSTVRLQFFAINAGEQIGVYGNNTRYYLTSSNLSIFNCGTTNMSATNNGYLEHSSGTYSNATVTVVFPTAVDSIKVWHVNGYGGGATYNLGFIWDTLVNIRQPFNDTMLCVGNNVPIRYEVNTKFNSNNIFTAQLSNSSGSFANPTVIGTLNSDTDATINWTIPNTVANGTGYRIRVVSSSPVRMSEDNGKDIRIGNIDSAGINVSGNSPGCLGDTLNFNATCNIQGATFLWTGPNSFYAQVPNPSISPATSSNAGNYYSTIKFYGCTKKDTLSVTLKPSPNMPAVSSNSAICARDTLKLNGYCSTPGVSYSWTGPGNFTSNLQNPAIANTSMASAGDYTVTVNLAGCVRKNTTTVVVNNAPAIVSSGNNGPLCALDTLKINIGTSSTGVTYSWKGPNSFAASTQNTYIPNSSIAATGWYVATLNLNGCLFKDSTYAIVNPTPPAPAASYNNPLCAGETLQLTATSVANATYNWTGPGSFSSTQQNPLITNVLPANAGTYNVFSVFNGCPSPAGQVQVSVNALPFVVIQAAPGDTICAGNTVSFSTLPNNYGGTPQFKWYVNGQSTGMSGITYNTTTLKDADVVTCKMTEYTKCNSPYTDESNDIQITVLPWLAPAVTITANPNKVLDPNEYVKFTATPVNGGLAQTYQWKRNGQNIQGATSNTWSANTLNDNDIITVEMYSSYRCPQPPKALSNSLTVRVYNGIGDVKNVPSLSLYPNPNNGNFTIMGNLPDNESVTIRIINTVGQVIYGETMRPSGNRIDLRLNQNLAQGIYLLQVNSVQNTASLSFNVQ